MQRKDIKYKIILLATILVAFIFGYSFLHKTFIQNTTYCKPFLIKINGLNNAQFQHVNCEGVSPTGRKIKIKKDDKNYSFHSESYMHLDDIVFYCDDSISNKITAISFNYQNNASTYFIDSLNIKNTLTKNDSLKNSQQISFKRHFNPKHSDIRILSAILMWSGWYRILYIFIISIFVLFFIIKYRHSILSLLSKLLNLSKRLYSKLDIENRLLRYSITIILCIVLSIVFFNKTDFTGISLEIKESMTQSIAVNLASGHGFPKSGFIEDFENYKISKYHSTGDLTYTVLKKYKGAYIYHNPPIHELFMGSIYYIVGVNPLLLKQIQLFILIITISSLPLLGFKLAGKFGFLSGLISAPIILEKYHSLANQLEPNILIILFLFLLSYWFKKSILEEKYYKVIIIGLLLSLIVLTQLTLILLPCFLIIYLLFIFFKRPNRKTAISLIILIASFLIPISFWSLYASNHLNTDTIKNYSFAEVHNTLLNRDFDSQDITILEGLKDYSIVKRNDSIINDGGWVGSLSVYENDLVDNIVIPSLFYSKRIFIATKSAPNLLFIAHNEYCNKGNPSTDWTKHSDSYYNNDNQSFSPYFRVFLFYLNHPKQLFSGAIDKLYNGFSAFNYLFIVIWIYIINFLFFYLQAFLHRKNQKYIKATKIFISLSLLIVALCIVNINYIVFYSTLIALFILILIKIFNRKIHNIKTPQVFVIVLLSLLFFVIATFGLERYIIVIDFIFVYQAIYSLIYFSFSDNYYSPTTTMHP